MFKFKYRLSLLFVLAALVAGVSVWLRQAVVRDRNIRELMNEDFASVIPSHDEQFLNTRILNYFCQDDRFYDNLSTLQIRIPLIKSDEIIQKYRACDFGGNVEELALIAWAEEDFDRRVGFSTRQFSFSQFQFWPNCFKNIGLFWIEGGTFFNDHPHSSITANCEKFSMRLTIIDIESLQNVLQSLKISPDRIQFDSNIVEAKFKELRALNIFDAAQLEYIDTHNTFSEQGYNESPSPYEMKLP